MVVAVLWTKRAISALELELEYYAKISPALAKELSKIISTNIDKISTTPGIGRPGKKINTRELVLSKYPYILAYRVRNNVLEILSIIHQNRKNIKSFY